MRQETPVRFLDLLLVWFLSYLISDLLVCFLGLLLLLEELPTPVFLGFACGSAGKVSTCNAGDLGLMPGLGRSPGEGKGYPLQYSGLENSMDCIVHGAAKSWTWLSDFHFHIHIGTSLMAQTVKNLPAMWESWAQSLCLEDPLEKRVITYSTILAWRIPWTEGPSGLLQSIGRRELDITEWLTVSHTHRDFPGVSVVKTLSFHCRGRGLDSWLGN